MFLQLNLMLRISHIATFAKLQVYLKAGEVF